MHRKYRIVVTDDHEFVRKGLVSILEHSHEFLVLGEAGNGLALLNLLHQGVVPDVMILDLSMPVLSGFEALRKIKQMDFSFKVLVLTMHKEPDLLCQAFLAGADGFMLKDGMARELLPALHTLLEDRIYLSPLMATDLPETCQMKVAAVQGLPSSLAKHCGKYFSWLQGASVLDI